MTYNSKGRSTIEVAVVSGTLIGRFPPSHFITLFPLNTVDVLSHQAVGFVCFLIGFVAVLCLGNYYRAKKAMERQKQRRLARLSGNAGNGVVGLENSSPLSSNHSTASTQFNEEQQNLLMGNWTNTGSGPARRRQAGDDDLLFDVNDTGPRAMVTSI
jgi:hypothetical protein